MNSKDGTKLFYESYDSKALKRLRSYFGHVVKGNDQDYRTPFYDGRPREEILNAWEKILEPKLQGMAELLDFENDLRAKVGPLSIMKPLSERMDDIDAYYDLIHLDSEPLNSEAIDTLLKQWGKQIGGLRLRSQTRTWEMMKKSTSSGSPFFTKRRYCYQDTVPCEVSWLDNVQNLSNRTYQMCATLGWRGQEGGLTDNDVKQRVIWMFPFAANVCELQCYQPLIEACQRFNLVPAWNGNDYVDEAVTRLFDTKGKDDVIICTDFEKFDQHFNAHMQQCAADVLSGLFTQNGFDKWMSNTFKVKYEIPLAYNFGETRTGSHGMASGSGGTNADETLSHRCLQLEAAITSGAELNPNSMCLGDDGILTYPGADVDHVIRTYTKHGQEMNESKQDVSKTEATYLRRWYGSEYRIDGVCRGVYSTYRALGKLMGQERFYDPDDWGPEMVELRYLSIIENVKWHPAREEFLDFCMKGDKYRLGIDLPGFFDNLARIKETSEIADDFVSYTSGDNVGINDWWVVKALKARS
nr:RNA-dependent RNA polymerase [Picobirnavirus sp.]